MSTLTLKVPARIDAKLHKEANRRGVRKSKVVLQLLEAALGANIKTTDVSAYELMKNGFGIIDSRAGDLSYNKKHLEGYGR